MSMMPHLAATFNFGAYLKNINKMGHFIGSKWEYTKFTNYNNIVLNYTPIHTLPVVAQCNVTLQLKYDAGTTLCAAITSCVPNDLKARFCKDENKGIVCQDNYHWGNFFTFLIKMFIYLNKLDTLNSATTGKCQNVCSNDDGAKKYYVRAPGSSTVTSLCNIICDPKFQKCQNLNSSELLDLFKNYICKADYDRVAYNCVLKTTSKKGR